MSEAGHPYQRLTPDTVIDAVESLGYRSDARILALNSYENRVYQVGLEEGGWLVAKFYRPGRWHEEQISEEHAFSHELAGLEIPVVAPLSDEAGRTIQSCQGFQFALFPHHAGRPPETDSLDELLVLGRFIGRIHRVGAAQPFIARASLSVDRLAVESREYLLRNDFLHIDVRQAYESLSADLVQVLQDRLAPGLGENTIRIHGDCHLGNVLLHEGSPWFVDLDDTLNGPAIQDLWMLLSGTREQRQAQLSELVEGYNEFYDFNPAQLNLVEGLRTLRIMSYAAWLARRWDDPTFPLNFPWFNTPRYWSEHVLQLREQRAALDELPLRLY